MDIKRESNYTLSLNQREMDLIAAALNNLNLAENNEIAFVAEHFNHYKSVSIVVH